MPAVSIILPAYNCVSFIREAIESILRQTFTDFELIIINDGSTDDTEMIIKSFTDHRIHYIKNEINLGLISTLNKGIKIAKGEYIARMDADDISLPNRLAHQKQWLDAHPGTAVVASLIEFIDENNALKGHWILDRETITATAIKNKLPVENCIAHPSIMGKKNLFLKYPYNMKQKHIEDYDLWLRIAADGNVIEKIPEVLLQYRVHSSSITNSHLRKENFYFKHVSLKKTYILSRIQNNKFNAFDVAVILQMIIDLFKGAGKEMKNAFKKA